MEDVSSINLSMVNKFDIKIPHRNWKQAFAEAFVLMSTAMPGEVISIVGPSRAGKTSLLNELIKSVISPEIEECDNQPVVQIVVENKGGNASFSYKAFIADLLELIKHPVYSKSSDMSWYKVAESSRLVRATEAMLVRALIEGLKHRKTRYLIVDEAQDIKYAGKKVMAASGVMDSLKTLAFKANVILVVCGTYPMLQSMNFSAHLENRKHDVHLSRYRQNQEDIEEFIWILSNFSSVIDLDESLPSLLDCAELLYEGTLGCVGLIRAWLYRASVLAVVEGCSINLSHIQRSMKSIDQLVTVANEIEFGERLLGVDTYKLETQLKTKKSSETKTNTGKNFQRLAKRFSANNRL